MKVRRFDRVVRPVKQAGQTSVLSEEAARVRYEHHGNPGPNAPLTLACDGCGTIVTKWTCWTQLERKDDKGGGYRATVDFDVCADCTVKIRALAPGEWFVPTPKRVNASRRERAQIVAFLRREVGVHPHLMTPEMRDILVRVEAGHHRKATRGGKGS